MTGPPPPPSSNGPPGGEGGGPPGPGWPPSPDMSCWRASLNNTIGALLVGVLVATALWGVILTYTLRYFGKPRREVAWFKLLVLLLLFLATFESVLDGHILYFFTVSNRDDPQAMCNPLWSFMIHFTVTSLSNFVIQSLFIRRIYQLSGNNVLLVLWTLGLAVAELVSGIVITGRGLRAPTFDSFNRLSDVYFLHFTVGTTCSLSIAATLVYYQRQLGDGLRRMGSILTMANAYVMNTGVLVAFDAVAAMIAYAIMPQNYIFFALYILLSKLNLASYLSTLHTPLSSGLRHASTSEDNVALTSRNLPSLGGSSRFSRIDTSFLYETGAEGRAGVDGQGSAPIGSYGRQGRIPPLSFGR